MGQERYLIDHNQYPRLAPWATDLPPIRGYGRAEVCAMKQRQT
jgi:hypothetical protein